MQEIFRSARMLAHASIKGRDVLVIAISFHDKLGGDRGALARLSRTHDFGFSFVDLQCLTSFPFPQDEALAAVAAISSFAREFGRVVTYGASVGGFVALRFAGFLGADTAVVAAPQFSFDPKKMPSETRWAKQRKSVPGFPWDDMAPALRALRRIYLIHDPASPAEMAHVRLIAQAAPCTVPLPVPYGGHMVSKVLHQCGVLCPLIDDIVAGQFDRNAFRQAVRRGRRGSPVYLGTLADALPERRDRLRIRLLEMAHRLDPSADNALALLLPLLRLGYDGEAQEMIQTIAALDATNRQRLAGLKNANAKLQARVSELEEQIAGAGPDANAPYGIPRALRQNKPPVDDDPPERRARPAE
jgi:hypothetical protein